MNSFLIILPTKIAKFWLICVAPPLKIVKRTKCVHRLQTVYANMHVKNSICPFYVANQIIGLSFNIV